MQFTDGRNAYGRLHYKCSQFIKGTIKGKRRFRLGLLHLLRLQQLHHIRRGCDGAALVVFRRGEIVCSAFPLTSTELLIDENRTLFKINAVPHQTEQFALAQAGEEIDEEQARKMTEKLKKSQFDFEDYLESMKQMRKMGGLGSIMNMLPGLGGMGGYRDFGKRICHYRLPYSCDGGEYRDGGKLVGEGENHHADDYDSCAAAESAVCVHACSGKASGDSGGILYDFLRRGLYH